MPEAPASRPAAHELAAPGAWRAIDFVSDLHLSAESPRTHAAFADYLERTRADAVFILGDLFEVWVGDDAREDAFERACAEALARAASRRTLGFMVGNRDFLVGPGLLGTCGVRALPDPTLLAAFGQRVLLTHGDALCLSDTDYQRFRAQVRSERWQADFLARPLAERRHLARGLRDASEQRKRQSAPAGWPDVDAVAALRWMDEAGASTLVHGHTHRPASEPLAPDARLRHVLSDWDYDHPPLRGEVLRLDAAGWRRIAPADAAAP